MKATDLEANPEEMKSVVVYEEVSKEEAMVEMVRTLKDRHLAVRRRGQPKKRTQKKLTAACRGMTCPAIPAWRKGHGHQEPGRDSVAREAPK
jgi:hypothetical protein